MPEIVFVDVDDTLIRSFGSKRIPISRTVEFVRARHAAGASLFCWSRGGAEYARSSAAELGIEELFVAFLPKPDVVVDDAKEKLLDHCTFLHPFELRLEID